MKLTRAAGTLSLLAFTAIAYPFAFAEEAGWYGGLNIGQSRAKIDDARITSGLIGGGFASAALTNDDRDTGFKVFGGYQFNKNFSLEGGYFDLGRFGFVANTVPLGSLTGNIKIKSVNLDLVGTLPLTERLSAFGRLGVSNAKAEDRFTGTGLVRVLNPNPSKRDTNGKFGVGLQYAFTDSLGMRAEVERYRINDAVGNKGDVDLVSLGLVYRFGAKRQTYVARATQPEPVAPAPRAVVETPVVVAPPPQPVVVPPPLMKVSFSADALFDFDKATIKPAGKQSLDKLVADLRGARIDAITVTGHTDRIGTTAYNMALSTRRADAVKTYLVEPSGLPGAKIATRGVGESSPVTRAADCKGQKANKALIACLQPDRRVDVEVTGTR